MDGKYNGGVVMAYDVMLVGETVRDWNIRKVESSDLRKNISKKKTEAILYDFGGSDRGIDEARRATKMM